MSQVRADNITNRQGTGSPLFVNGIRVTGLTSISNMVAGIATFTSDVSIGGTLTYEDVTNIDSVGLITARSGLKVTAGGIDVAAGGANIVGVVTASTGIDAASNLILKTGGNEKVRIDSSGNVGINEAGPAGYGKFVVKGTGNIISLNASSGAASLSFFENGQGRFYIKTPNGSDGLSFVDADNSTERLRIGDAGQLGIAGANYGTSGQVLTSGGASAAPSWADAGGGAVEVIATLDLATTNTANIVSSGWTSANYSKIIVVLQDIGCGNGQGAKVAMRLYIDGSEITSGSRYEYSGYGNNDFGGGNFDALVAESGADYVMLTDAKWSYSLSGEIELWNPGFASGSLYGNHRTWTGKTHAAGGSDFAKMGYMHGYMKTSNNSVINGIKFYEESSGKTFTSGKVTVYGYKRS